ncbi:MAG TPA: transglutaminase family protein [Deltaproteobacteria bacterium]|nr:transglutaminase family protein [Deltaproteobacteria bacterium]
MTSRYLEPTAYIESAHPAIASFALEETRGCSTPREKATRLYYAVRDGIRYNPYCTSLNKALYRASYVLEQGQGFCVQKAILLAAAARAAGVPCRLGFAIVKNHLATQKLIEIMQSDLFVFHGYTVFQLEGAWIKATPAFDLALCERFGVIPLEFDGRTDSLFHPYDREGKRHMEYVHDYGQFDDFPFETMCAEFKRYYPRMYEDLLKLEGSSPVSNADIQSDPPLNT